MKLRFDHARLDSNHHGTQKKGEPWNNQTVHGWKLKLIKLETLVRVRDTWVVQSMVGRRLILYKPSGACWYFDAYLSMTVEQ